MTRRDQRFRNQLTMFDGPIFVPDFVPVAKTSCVASVTSPTVDHGVLSRNETYVETLPNHTKQSGFVLAAIAAAGLHGITREELAGQCNLPIGSICGRVRELKESGDVVDTERRRPTSNGKSAAVVVCKRLLDSASDTSAFHAFSCSQSPKASVRLESVMPDQITCPRLPVDDRGEPMCVGCVYHINNRYVTCFESDGDMFLHPCTIDGKPIAGLQPQHAGLLPASVRVVRVVTA